MSRKTNILAAAALAIGCMAAAAPAQAQERTLGEIFTVGFNFCPRGSSATDGQLLPIAQNTALFSLLGTTFGGDGRTSFGLPDLRGRAPIHMGNGPGLSSYSWGQRGGSERNTLTVLQMPNHSHTGEVRAENTAVGDTGNPKDNAFARSTLNVYSKTAVPTAAGAFHDGTLFINPTGGGQSVNNIQPFLTIRSCIAMVGIFPSRN